MLSWGGGGLGEDRLKITTSESETYTAQRASDGPAARPSQLDGRDGNP